MSVTFTFFRSPILIRNVSIVNSILFPMNGTIGYVFKTPVWKQGDLTPWVSVPFSVLLALVPYFLVLHDRSLDEAIDNVVPGFYANSEGGVARFLALLGASMFFGLNLFWISLSWHALK